LKDKVLSIVIPKYLELVTSGIPILFTLSYLVYPIYIISLSIYIIFSAVVRICFKAEITTFLTTRLIITGDFT